VDSNLESLRDRAASLVVDEIALEPERSPRRCAGGWLRVRGQAVVVPRRAFRVIEAWLAVARSAPERPVRLATAEIAACVPGSTAWRRLRSGARVAFADLRGIMNAVARALRDAGLGRARARVREGAYEFPAIVGVAEPPSRKARIARRRKRSPRNGAGAHREHDPGGDLPPS
jgi:hypothetical protein